MSPHLLPSPSCSRSVSTGRYTEVARKGLCARDVGRSRTTSQDYHDWVSKQPGWSVHTIASHHYPMATMPEATAALLIDIVDFVK